MSSNRRIRIALDCSKLDPRQGIGTAVLALANALSQSENAEQQYTFIIPEILQEWLRPYIFGPCRLACVPASGASRLKESLRAVAPLRSVWAKLRTGLLPVPVSSGYVESEGFDLVHSPTQNACLTRLPSIYQPWDLQHLHYPHLFSKTEFALRERSYRAYCAQAAFVCVQTEWTRQDVIDKYGISPERVAVIRWGSVLDAYAASLPEQHKKRSKNIIFPGSSSFIQRLPGHIKITRTSSALFTFLRNGVKDRRFFLRARRQSFAQRWIGLLKNWASLTSCTTWALLLRRSCCPYLPRPRQWFFRANSKVLAYLFWRRFKLVFPFYRRMLLYYPKWRGMAQHISIQIPRRSWRRCWSDVWMTLSFANLSSRKDPKFWRHLL